MRLAAPLLTLALALPTAGCEGDDGASPPTSPSDGDSGADVALDAHMDQDGGPIGTDSDPGDGRPSDAEAGPPLSDATDTNATDTNATDSSDPNRACTYTLHHEDPGEFLQITDSNWTSRIDPAGADQGFRCIRVEYDVDAPDNMSEIIAMGIGCPVFLHNGGVSLPEGPRGGGLLTSWFRFRGVGCVPRNGADLEVAVNSVSDGFRNHVVPGQRYHVTLELDRLQTATMIMESGGAQVGPTVTLPVSAVDHARTEGWYVRFGLPRIGDEAYFPYFGARYFDLQVFTDTSSP